MHDILWIIIIDISVKLTPFLIKRMPMSTKISFLESYVVSVAKKLHLLNKTTEEISFSFYALI